MWCVVMCVMCVLCVCVCVKVCACMHICMCVQYEMNAFATSSCHVVMYTLAIGYDEMTCEVSHVERRVTRCMRAHACMDIQITHFCHLT